MSDGRTIHLAMLSGRSTAKYSILNEFDSLGLRLAQQGDKQDLQNQRPHGNMAKDLTIHLAMASGNGTAKRKSSKESTALGWKRRSRDTSKILRTSAQVAPSFTTATDLLPSFLVADAVFFVRPASSACDTTVLVR